MQKKVKETIEKKPKKPEQSLVKKETQTLSTTTPVTGIFVDEARAKEHWDAEDHKSLLDFAEDAPKIHDPITDFTNAKVDAVFRNIDLPISDELRPRIRSLILSRLKGIRSNDQVEEKLAASKEIGGFAFTETEISQVMRAIALGLNHKKSQIKEVKNIPKIQKKDTSPSIPLPPEEIIANTKKQPVLEPMTNNVLSRQSTGNKPILHDVLPAQNHTPIPEKPSELQKAKASIQINRQSMGPVQELENMSIVAFRRLSPDPKNAIVQVENMINTIKNESFLFYIEAKKAWYSSPLFLQYHGLITEAINSKRTLQEQLAFQNVPNPLTMADLEVLITFNHSLI